MKATLHKHRQKLQSLFAFYAGADSTTINIRELNEMCEAFPGSLFNSRFGLREMVSAFVRVNIDDELYEQEDADNTSTELVFEEFEEVIARIFNAREWDESQGDGAGDTLEQAFDLWLQNAFWPVMLRECEDIVKQQRRLSLSFVEGKQ